MYFKLEKTKKNQVAPPVCYRWIGGIEWDNISDIGDLLRRYVFLGRRQRTVHKKKLFSSAKLENIFYSNSTENLAYLEPQEPIILRQFVSAFKMSKRNSESNNESSSLAKQPKKHWSLGLLDTMKDPKYVYKDSERVVVIKDKYPKAKVHYLVMPREQINSIFSLSKTHLSLLEEFGTFIEDIKQEHKDANIVAGFHAVPSMHLMHMHVISKDMISDCLKTKAHWNSFTTKFFIPYEEMLERIRKDGAVKRISNETHKQLLATPLKCNQCEFVPKNLPNLKQHLLTHNS